MHQTLRRSAALLALALAGVSAQAIPNLQLGIKGATYVGGTEETSVATTNPFDLWAFLNKGPNSTSVSDTYFISAALVRTDGGSVPNTSANLGSFKFAGVDYNVTGNMVYGNPPLETALDHQGGSDLAPHGIFPTWFKEFSFTFDSNAKYVDLNTAPDPDDLTTPVDSTLATLAPFVGNANGNGYMYGQTFAVDVSNLAAGYAIHFDLYNSDVAACSVDNCTNFDIDKVAPFSHDAQSGGGGCTQDCGPGGPGPGVPEPPTTALLGVALLAAWRFRKTLISTTAASLRLAA
jgi:MYXO-CTERM domain-containing protein